MQSTDAKYAAKPQSPAGSLSPDLHPGFWAPFLVEPLAMGGDRVGGARVALPGSGSVA